MVISRRYINRRFFFAVVIAALLVAVPAVLAISGVPFSGSLDTSSPTFRRASNCTGLSSVSYYATQEFDVSETATYTIEMTDANLAPSEFGPQDTYLLLYNDSFDPADPLTNCLAYNDDIDFPDNVLSGITRLLTAGHYIAVITTYDGTATGTYEGFISGGSGEITLGSASPPADDPADAPAAPALPWDPGDGRLNPDPAAPAAVYFDSDALKVYLLNDEAKGYEVLSMPATEIMAQCSPTPAANTLIASADEGHVRLYCLSTGEIQLNVNQGATETAYVWDALPPSSQTTYTFNADGELLSGSPSRPSSPLLSSSLNRSGRVQDAPAVFVLILAAW